jgi:hypothetical protein
MVTDTRNITKVVVGDEVGQGQQERGCTFAEGGGQVFDVSRNKPVTRL